MSVRKKLIKIAYENSEIREVLLPILIDQHQTLKQAAQNPELAKKMKSVFQRLHDSIGAGGEDKSKDAQRLSQQLKSMEKEFRGAVLKADKSKLENLFGTLQDVVRDNRDALGSRYQQVFSELQDAEVEFGSDPNLNLSKSTLEKLRKKKVKNPETKKDVQVQNLPQDTPQQKSYFRRIWDSLTGKKAHVLIKLAYENPELREGLFPLIQKLGSDANKFIHVLSNDFDLWSHPTIKSYKNIDVDLSRDHSRMTIDFALSAEFYVNERSIQNRVLKTLSQLWTGKTWTPEVLVRSDRDYDVFLVHVSLTSDASRLASQSHQPILKVLESQAHLKHLATDSNVKKLALALFPVVYPGDTLAHSSHYVGRISSWISNYKVGTGGYIDIPSWREEFAQNLSRDLVRKSKWFYRR